MVSITYKAELVSGIRGAHVSQSILYISISPLSIFTPGIYVFINYIILFSGSSLNNTYDLK